MKKTALRATKRSTISKKKFFHEKNTPAGNKTLHNIATNQLSMKKRPCGQHNAPQYRKKSSDIKKIPSSSLMGGWNHQGLCVVVILFGGFEPLGSSPRRQRMVVVTICKIFLLSSSEFHRVVPYCSAGGDVFRHHF